MAGVKVRRQGKESPHTLIYRFKKAVQESGILLRKRQIMFKERPKSKEKKKEAALRRERMKKYYEKLEKLGKISK